MGPDEAVLEMVPRDNRDWQQKEQFVSGRATDRSKFDVPVRSWANDPTEIVTHVCLSHKPPRVSLLYCLRLVRTVIPLLALGISHSVVHT